MKYILESQILNQFRSTKPKGFYSKLLAHTGQDLNYHFEELPSPVTGEIEKVTKQVEMGNVIYLKDTAGNIHVFAHMDRIDVKVGKLVNRNDVLGLTGNTGGKTTAPHLHYEVICFNKPSNWLEALKVRKLNGYVGWNLNPLLYVRELYGKYRINSQGVPIK